MSSGLQIQNSNLHVEGIRALKQDIQVNEDLLAQLKNDGLDEVIFEKKGQLYVAYKDNLDLSNLTENREAFNPERANQMGQLFLDGEPVKVIFKDDEVGTSFWTQPYKGIAGILDDPTYKAAAVGVVAGAVTGVVYPTGLGQVGKLGAYIGSGIGAAASAARAEAEISRTSDSGMGVMVTIAGGIGGHALGQGLYYASQYLKDNPKVLIGVGTAAAGIVGTGLVLDLLSDTRAKANYTVLNRIAQ